jgi:hypothetical protein
MLLVTTGVLTVNPALRSRRIESNVKELKMNRINQSNLKVELLAILASSKVYNETFLFSRASFMRKK